MASFAFVIESTVYFDTARCKVSLSLCITLAGLPGGWTVPQPGVHQTSVQPGGDLQDAVPRLGAPLRPWHQEGKSNTIQSYWTADTGTSVSTWTAAELLSGGDSVMTVPCVVPPGSVCERVRWGGDRRGGVQVKDQTRTGERHLQLLHANSGQGTAPSQSVCVRDPIQNTSDLNRTDVVHYNLDLTWVLI